MFTVLLMEPCCEMSADWYDPGPRPVWHRTPGAWPPSCGHPEKRIPVITTHTDKAEAESRYAETRGWHALKGWMHEGEMPPEGERFRIMGVHGGGGSGWRKHSPPSKAVFPTVDLARECAEKWRNVLYDIVGDTDTRVRWSSYGVKVGTVLEPFEPA
jgi:hypothetical protein